MKNNPYILLLSIVVGLSMGTYLQSSKIVFIIFNILRGIR